MSHKSESSPKSSPTHDECPESPPLINRSTGEDLVSTSATPQSITLALDSGSITSQGSTSAEQQLGFGTQAAETRRLQLFQTWSAQSLHRVQSDSSPVVERSASGSPTTSPPVSHSQLSETSIGDSDSVSGSFPQADVHGTYPFVNNGVNYTYGDVTGDAASFGQDSTNFQQSSHHYQQPHQFSDPLVGVAVFHTLDSLEQGMFNVSEEYADFLRYGGRTDDTPRIVELPDGYEEPQGTDEPASSPIVEEVSSSEENLSGSNSSKSLENSAVDVTGESVSSNNNVEQEDATAKDGSTGSDDGRNLAWRAWEVSEQSGDEIDEEDTTAEDDSNESQSDKSQSSKSHAEVSDPSDEASQSVPSTSKGSSHRKRPIVSTSSSGSTDELTVSHWPAKKGGAPMQRRTSSTSGSADSSLEKGVQSAKKATARRRPVGTKNKTRHNPSTSGLSAKKPDQAVKTQVAKAVDEEDKDASSKSHSSSSDDIFKRKRRKESSSRSPSPSSDN